MHLLADLHVHSRFSRATSPSLNLATLVCAALEKGITIVGTGDVTHPGWRQEIKEQLEPAEEGLFRLTPSLERQVYREVPSSCHGQVRFVLQTEISCIYKKNDRVRKVHLLVYLPSLAAVDRLSSRLGEIGNLSADGRPILGLDSRDLLEMVLECDEQAFIIPAHIFTPWFSVFGSRSGFDTLDACFGDLSSHVFAAETGLSADPAMCRQLRQLDRLTLVSSSDAHSPAKLGREATVLDIDLGYPQLRAALEKARGYLGTLEVYPEYGKYHHDGHRRCGQCCSPEQTRRLQGRCPGCKKQLTVGVLSRVTELAEHERDAAARTATVEKLVSLDEVLSQVLGYGPSSQRVRRRLQELRSALGPELQVLRQVPINELSATCGEMFGEAVRRLRRGEVHVTSGFDGVYGAVRIFTPQEMGGKRER